jgi:hypothetical protein
MRMCLLLTEFRGFLHRFASQTWDINNVCLIQVHRKSNVGVLDDRNNEPLLGTSTEGLTCSEIIYGRRYSKQ